MLPQLKKLKKEIYFDHASTTYLDPEVKKVMEPFWREKYGNPSAPYSKGREAREAVDQARKTIAALIGAKPEEIIFTAGGTESVNLAIFGVAKKFSKKHHLIASAIEHASVLNSLKALAGEGYQSSLVDVDSEGFVNIDELKKLVKPETIFISVIYANNEIGTIQPIAEIGKWLKVKNLIRRAQNLPAIVFHSDACQAAGVLDLNVNKLGVDLLTVNGSKIYGPKQTGFLYVRLGTNIMPSIYGGGQEQGLRSGTENVAGIIGLAKAFELAQKNKNKENERLLKLSGQLYKKIKSIYSKAILNGPVNREGLARRLPNNLNLVFPGVEGESLMLYLDSYGICVSTGSACDSAKNEPSHVLKAIGRSAKQARESIRITLGKENNLKQVYYFIKILKPVQLELARVANQS